MELCGKKKCFSKDHFEGNINVFHPFTTVKWKTHVNYQHNQSSTSLKRLCEARNKGNALYQVITWIYLHYFFFSLKAH